MATNNYFLNKHKKLFATVAFILAVIILLPEDIYSNDTTTKTAKATEYLPAVASAKGRVDIEGGVIRLAAKRDGVITSVLAEEGDQVKTGDVLAILDDTLARSRMDLARDEVALVEHNIKKSEIALHAAKREMTRMRPLAARNSVSQREFDQAVDLATTIETELAAFRTSMKVALSRVAVAENEVAEHQIVAPMNGRIIRRQASPGNGASTLNVTPLFLFAPDVPRIIRAEMDEQFLPQVQAGQPVEIVSEADQKVRFSGKVARVGMLAGKRRAPSDDPAEKQDARVIEVVINFEEDALLIGQRVIVRFLSQ